MNLTSPQNTKEVIAALDEIIQSCIENESVLGYFPALYKRVTERVRSGILNGEFEDAERMEHFDVVFAQRYLDAYNQHTNGYQSSLSWDLAFRQKHVNKITVMQHLLLGMNAHINLDLGLAAAQIAPGQAIHALKNDFFKINDLLFSQVNPVEDRLSTITPWLGRLDRLLGSLDEEIVNFNLKMARDWAWSVALKFAEIPQEEWAPHIEELDKTVVLQGRRTLHPNFFIRLLLYWVRFTERGTTAQKIQRLTAP